MAQVRAAGLAVDRVPYAEWERMLRAAARRPHDGRRNSVAAVAAMHEALPDRATGPAPRFERRNTLLGLAGLGIHPPVVDDPLLARYVHHLVESDLLPKT